MITERQMIILWQKVFDTEDVNGKSNFFEMGGNSLLAVEIIERIEQTYGVEVPILAFFENSTPQTLASLLGRP